MTNNHHHYREPATDPAAGLRTSGRAGLLIVAAGMGLITMIGLVRRLAHQRPGPPPPPVSPDVKP